MPDRLTLLSKIREWASAHNVPVDPDLDTLTEDELILWWVRLQMADNAGA